MGERKGLRPTGQQRRGRPPTSPTSRPESGGQSTGQPGPSTGDGFKSSAPRHNMDYLHPTRPHELLCATIPSGAEMEAEPHEGSCGSAPASVLITCLFEHLLKMLQNLKDPLLAKAKDQNWLTEEGWRYQTWSTSLGALVPDKRALKSMLETMLPLLGTPYMVNRFQANWGSK